ncbi:cytochrome c oxidase assembly factor CtaG [Bacillus taeanensis]|uniref:Cytochrome c oxidase assembly factor CtaG n=1 Tax=Bacillus taeanensis TaxID=273032 RepID=A0A366XMQ7_9BACI|nr:cytochrome c oxidase assembly factor CtaG [Bacillus taeanensis]RBW67412.1 cytochrome c oxidase assembly factor CtaG [Bacillus taeanensis]
MGVEYFGWRALWNPEMIVVTLILAVLYVELIGPLRRFFPDSAPATLKQKLFFFLGLLALYAAKGSPMEIYSHFMFSVHMTQMAIFFLVMPPLLMLGIPAWAYRPLFRMPRLSKVLNFITKPLLTVIIFNGLFSFYHMPMVFDKIMANEFLHFSYVSVLLVTAFLMWWPLLCPLPEKDHMSGLAKLGYIFADGILITPACALIIFAETPLYQTYTDPAVWVQVMQFCVPAGISLDGLTPQQFSWFDTVEDQQLGGIVMKIIQEIVYGTVLGVVIFAWMKKERANDQYDLNPSAKFLAMRNRG